MLSLPGTPAQFSLPSPFSPGHPPTARTHLTILPLSWAPVISLSGVPPLHFFSATCNSNCPLRFYFFCGIFLNLTDSDSEIRSVMSNSLRTQAPLPMEFSRPEYRSGQLFAFPGDVPNPGIEPRYPVLQADSLPSEPSRKPEKTGVGSLSLLQGILPTQELNWGLLHCRQILYQLSYQGSPFNLAISNPSVLCNSILSLTKCCIVFCANFLEKKIYTDFMLSPVPRVFCAFFYLFFKIALNGIFILFYT